MKIDFRLENSFWLKIKFLMKIEYRLERYLKFSKIFVFFLEIGLKSPTAFLYDNKVKLGWKQGWAVDFWSL